MRRTITAVLAALALTMGAAAHAADAHAADTKKPETIRFAYQLSHSNFVIANDQGWFKDEFAKDGITFDARLFVSGPPIIEAFAGSRIDFGLTGDQPALLARANNIDIKAVGVPISGGKGLALLVPPDSPAQSIADLKGKKIGVTVGSVAHHFLFILLKNAGLKPSDIQLVNLSPPDIKLALEQHNIDAGLPWDPWLSILEEEHNAKKLVTAEGIKPNANVILVSAAFARDYPDIVERILKVFLRAETFIKEHPQEAIAITAKATGYKPEVVARYIPNQSYDIRLTPAVIDSYELTTSFLREGGVLRRDVSVAELVDASFLKHIGAQ